MTKAGSYRYQVGGALPADASTYVIREADTALFEALLGGEYCYILDARQMGKSSLRARTMQRLGAEGIVSTEIELSGIGSQQITARQWYGGIIWELISGFSLSVNRRQWLLEHDGLSPVQRFGTFIETVLLTQISRPIVIFFDEIDSILGLDFSTDDFFALIRHCYEKRASDQRYRRLSIVLIGAASPSDLICNRPLSTPFNIGRAIALKGFQNHEVMPLAQGFEQEVRNPAELLKHILHWTGGQPFLTQKICSLIQQKFDEKRERGEQAFELLSAEQASAFVAALVNASVIAQWETQDEPEHLRTIRDRILQTSHSSRLLKRYQQILRHGQIKVRQQADHLELRLSGLVVQQADSWVVKNPIYRAIFNPAWVRQVLAERSVPRLARHQTVVGQRFAWAMVALVSLTTTGAVLSLRFAGVLQPWELQAFDQLMRLRPSEAPDPRLLIIEITEADVQAQNLAERGAASLSDRALNQLLVKLDRAQPRALGLDIYREQAVDPAYPQLAQWMRSQDYFFAICNYGNPGVPSPPEVPVENYGFNNVLEDPDGVVRRYPLAVSNPAPCRNAYALSWLLAARYLADEDIGPQITPDNYLQMGETVFKPLLPRTGGYQQIDARGHQVMVNYRATAEIATTVTLAEFLSESPLKQQGNRTGAQIAQGRIVIIGTSAPSFNDHRWRTPLRRNTKASLPLSGAEVQAHLVSQILSATLDQRPLIWTWHPVIELLWVTSWAVIGGVISGYSSTRSRWVLAVGSTSVVLLGLCWQLLLLGGWGPLVPAEIALLASSSSSWLLLRPKKLPAD